MCAMIPMLRVISRGYCRSTLLSSCFSLPRRGRPGPAPPLVAWVSLPAIMGEGLVRLRHLVSVLSLLHRGPPFVGGVRQLGGELLGHAALAAAARSGDQPAHRQR